ncbi:unnamed protein product [Hymenolepis diminuta]|uniref:Peptidase_S8 domain-containing protein n=1 Tax=Hymenolepis diminuta TaxID=6216 RepID=A0A158QEI3_HYMDI|nr:unnamed protein product [Hymenolepis diminuta]
MHFVRPELVNEFVIELAVEDQAKEVLESMGFELVRKLHGFERSYLAKLPENSLKNAPKIIHRIKRSAEIVLIEQQEKLIRTKRDFVTWNDPKYPDMWYLNRASLKDGNEVDLNVQEAWQLGYSGKGVVVTIMDDGLDHTHPDLAANYAEEASCDVNNGDRDPMPNTTNPDNKHGTRCAGQVAAIGNNSNCIVGVAFNAKIGGIRMLDGTITDRVEAESLNFNQNYIDIYSGSWGPDDTGRIYEGPGRLASEAFHKGATTVSKIFEFILIK